MNNSFSFLKWSAGGYICIPGALATWAHLYKWTKEEINVLWVLSQASALGYEVAVWASGSGRLGQLCQCFLKDMEFYGWLKDTEDILNMTCTSKASSASPGVSVITCSLVWKSPSGKKQVFPQHMRVGVALILLLFCAEERKVQPSNNRAE